MLVRYAGYVPYVHRVYDATQFELDAPAPADHRQHLDGFIPRSICQGYCASDLDIASIIDQADEKLFQLVLTNPNHVLSSLLDDKIDQRYYLRARRQNRQLVDKSNRLFSNNFKIHMLYKNCYLICV